MRGRRTRTAAGLAAATLGIAMLVPAGAAATTGEPIAQTGGMSATLPLLGTSLTVDITLDATGNITSVVLTPPEDFTQTTAESTRVRFDNSDGTTSVSVKAKGDRLTLTARAASLADVTGSGTWSADVFATGTPSTVDYTIGEDAGAPTLSIDSIVPAPGVDAVPVPVEAESEDDETGVTGGVIFSRDGFVKRLQIHVGVDEDGVAHLRITLSGKDRQRLTGSIDDLSGARTWSAHLCDGTPVTIDYHVDPDAMVVFDGATGGDVTLRPYAHGFQATFDGTRVGVKIGLTPSDEAGWTLTAKGFSGRCSGKAGEHGSKSDGWSGHAEASRDEDKADRSDDGDDPTHDDRSDD